MDEAIEQRVMETNERIAVMETEMKEKDQQITLLKDEMQQMKEVNNEMKEMKNAMQQQMTNMQSQLAALMRQMGHRVPSEHQSARQPTIDPSDNDEDGDLGLDDLIPILLFLFLLLTLLYRINFCTTLTYG